MKKLIVFSLSALLLLNTGCGLKAAKLMSVPEMEKDKLTVVENQKQGQGEEHESLDEVISAFLQEKAAFKAIDGETFEAHELYGTEEKEGKIFAYIWSRMSEFALEDGELVTGAGYSMPLVVVLEKDAAGRLEAIKYIAPEDGERYTASIRKMFPQEYHEKVLTRMNAKELDGIVRQKAYNYFNHSDTGLAGPAAPPDTPKSTEDTANAQKNKDGELEKVTGTFVGQIDNNSIEVMIDGVPEEKAAAAFRFSEAVESTFNKMVLKTGDKLEIEYITNGYDQRVIMEMRKLKE